MTEKINLIKEKLIRNKFTEIEKEVLDEFCDFFDFNKLIKIVLVNIDREDGILVLTKSLAYEIYFIGLESMEAENLFLSISENKALEKFDEYLEAFK